MSLWGANQPGMREDDAGAIDCAMTHSIITFSAVLTGIKNQDGWPRGTSRAGVRTIVFVDEVQSFSTRRSR